MQKIWNSKEQSKGLLCRQTKMKETRAIRDAYHSKRARIGALFTRDGESLLPIKYNLVESQNC